MNGEMKSRGTTILVLGIVGVVCCQLCAPFAWYMGSAELKRIAAGQAPASGESSARVGKILGIIGSVLMVLSMLWIFFAGGMAVIQGLRGAGG
ncbi:MAG: DUF4190 domain-containing protein [Thermoanaerobaculia bacterium]